MVTHIRMPQYAETDVEGTVLRWLKQEGDMVQQYEPLVELMTDKVTVEMPSPVSGRVAKILAQEGATVKVGAELAAIEGDLPSFALETRPAPSSSRAIPTPPPQPAPSIEGPRRYSPVVMKLAQEHTLDLSQVKGTGIGGRVTKEDVLAFLAERDKGQPPSKVEREAEEEAVPVTPVRRAIAERMARSAQTIPHAWAVYEADVTKMVKLREGVKESFRQREGVELTYLPFMVKAVCEALRAYPQVNAVWGGDKILIKKRLHISIAVATDAGLMVPVLHDADQKSIVGLARELHSLIDRARAGKLSPADIQGGTFTVNNAGAFGTVLSIPIINYPQAAILNIDAIRKQAVVLENDAIAVRSIMGMTLAFDHRVIDGAAAGRFLQRVKALLESVALDTPLA
jgi:2-oxoisovalerate dehydrogenase E2 component (dihydrolipoyl transacylase)